MSRLSAFLVAAGLAAGAIGTAGCAQCDTCDDFPAPCIGPNCPGVYASVAGPANYSGPGTSMNAPGGAPATGPASLAPADDAAGAKPTAPAVNPAPRSNGPIESKPATGEPSPPRPTEPAPPRARSGS